MRKFLLAALTFAPLLSGGPPANAQMAVLDVRAIAQAAQQVQQLTVMAASMKAQVASLGSNAASALPTINAQASQLLLSAGGIGFTGSSVATQFQSLYPNASSTNLPGLLQQYQSWSTENKAALQTAYAAQTQVAQQQSLNQQAVNGALASSQGAQGQTQAVQATNQLLATLSSQLAQLQTLLLTEQRATSAALTQQTSSNPAGLAESQRVTAFSPTTSSHAGDTAF